MSMRMSSKLAKKVFGVEVRRPRRPADDPPKVTWNSLSLDKSPRKGRFAVSEASARTIDGIVFDSKIEASRYWQLKTLERVGNISQLAVQPEWEIEINGQKFCRFKADFSYFCNERGHVVIEDVKSTGTQKDAAYRLRKKAAELAHGIRVVEVVL